jgi:acetylornithine deacetylase/succinyl-diaminopimelate desuccinylase-like protein
MSDDLQREAVAVLQRLVRMDTANPPGNERPAQEYLAGLLEPAGFEVELVGPDPERPNLIARLRGEADGPVLGLLVTSTPWSPTRPAGATTRGRAPSTRAVFPECVAYGFFPFRHMSLELLAELAHRRDERVDVRDLALAVDCYREVATELLG